jgi:hypothetical protein
LCSFGETILRASMSGWKTSTPTTHHLQTMLSYRIDMACR